jgi:hypothetical protein
VYLEAVQHTIVHLSEDDTGTDEMSLLSDSAKPCN